jgi:hypothetical protein
MLHVLVFLQAWGVMEYQLGNFSEARRLFQEGVWADPGNKDVVYIFQVNCTAQFCNSGRNTGGRWAYTED